MPRPTARPMAPGIGPPAKKPCVAKARPNPINCAGLICTAPEKIKKVRYCFTRETKKKCFTYPPWVQHSWIKHSCSRMSTHWCKGRRSHHSCSAALWRSRQSLHHSLHSRRRSFRLCRIAFGFRRPSAVRCLGLGSICRTRGRGLRIFRGKRSHQVNITKLVDEMVGHGTSQCVGKKGNRPRTTRRVKAGRPCSRIHAGRHWVSGRLPRRCCSRSRSCWSCSRRESYCWNDGRIPSSISLRLG